LPVQWYWYHDVRRYLFALGNLSKTPGEPAAQGVYPLKLQQHNRPHDSRFVEGVAPGAIKAVFPGLAVRAD
jgi:hypothetical protein